MFLRRTVTLVVATFALAASTAAPATYVGTNYSHWSISECSMDGTGILASYNATAVRQQLAAMKANGVQSLRLIVWHMTEIAEHRWGVIPSDLRAPYRSNLVSYLRAVRSSGIGRLELSFGPMWTNSPIYEWYDTTKLEENWRFIRTVRSLAREYGPSSLRFDLLNEGIPSDYWPHAQQLERYVTEIWRRYRSSYGTRDATVSAFADPNRVRNAKRILVPAPGFWEIHLPYDPAAADAAVLDASAVLGNPLVVGEAAYDDAAIDAAIDPYGVETVTQWPLRRGSACPAISESPPYAVTAYK